MKCPIDGTLLAMAERQGVEIDYCPECRGVWLDRGEIDKIIDYVHAEYDRTAAKTNPNEHASGSDRHDDGNGHRGHEQDDRHSGHKGSTTRKSRFTMLSDMLGGGED